MFLESIFSDSGERIKSVAKVAFVIESIADILAFLYVRFVALSDKVSEYDESNDLGLMLFVILLLLIGAAYISNLFLYGFGELICSTTRTSFNTSANNSQSHLNYENLGAASSGSQRSVSRQQPVITPPSVKHPQGSEWVCSNCGDTNPSNTNICKGCGKYR